jgi:hypothetical protein
MVSANGADGVSGSIPTARRIAVTALLAAVAAVPVACGAHRAEVWVRNMTDRTYSLLLATGDGPDRLAFVEILPASQGLAHQAAGRPISSFVLFSADCRPLAGGVIKGARMAILIDDRGVALDTRDAMIPVDVLADLRPWPAYQAVEDCRDPRG